MLITAMGRIPRTIEGNIRFFSSNLYSSPKSSNSNKLPVIFKPVISAKTKPKIQAKIIELKKDGILIPNVLNN